MGRRSLKPNASGAQGSTLQKDKIVESIAYAMSSGEWQPYRSVRELAARLNIDLANAQKYAAEATRLLRLSWGGDEAKVIVLENLRNIGRASIERTEEVVDAKGNVITVRKPDMATAGRMNVALASILGLTGSNSEVVIRLQQMSDSDLAQEATRFLAQFNGDHNGRRQHAHETTGEEVPTTAEGTDRAADDSEDERALSRFVAATQP